MEAERYRLQTEHQNPEKLDEPISMEGTLWVMDNEGNPRPHPNQGGNPNSLPNSQQYWEVPISTPYMLWGHQQGHRPSAATRGGLMTRGSGLGRGGPSSRGGFNAQGGQGAPPSYRGPSSHPRPAPGRRGGRGGTSHSAQATYSYQLYGEITTLSTNCLSSLYPIQWSHKLTELLTSYSLPPFSLSIHLQNQASFNRRVPFNSKFRSRSPPTTDLSSWGPISHLILMSLLIHYLRY